ncbi:MAG: glycosyltransferase [Candidatus Wolfebacteria bacterium]|nr:glycosyltransferase [Candidatus Wolfebacteria bacterium]
MNQSPKISILCPVFNSKEFIKDTVESVLKQSYKDWELIIMDAGSTDGTLDILGEYSKKYENIRVFSEPDEGAWHGIMKGLVLSRGEFVCFTYASDGYLNPNWLLKCMEVFKNDKEISLVWGIPFNMTENGKVVGPHFAYAQFLDKNNFFGKTNSARQIIKRYRFLNPSSWVGLIKKINFTNFLFLMSIFKRKKPPQKQDWFFYWLKTALIFPDCNMCVYKKVFLNCIPEYVLGSKIVDAYMDFYFNFNAKGYLSYCLPISANFARIHEGQLGQKRRAEVERMRSIYLEKVKELRKEVLSDKKNFIFIDKEGSFLN